jgi:hypothetical protein
MFIRILVTFFLGIVLIAQTSGQELITGRVLNRDTKSGVKEAKIRIGRSDSIVISNFLGFFQTKADTSATLTISATGYETGEFKVPANNFTVLLSPQPEEIYLIVEDPSRPLNGYESFTKYLASEFACNGNMKSGEMMIELITNKEGSLKYVTIIKNDYSENCAEDIVKLLTNAPKWKPATQRDVAVFQKHRLVLTFERDKISKVRPIASEFDPHWSMTLFLMQNLRYPEYFKNDSMTLEIYVLFENNALTRSMDKVQIINCADDLFRQELSRVIKKIPYDIIHDLYPANKKLIQPIILSFNSSPEPNAKIELPEGDIQKAIAISHSIKQQR